MTSDLQYYTPAVLENVIITVYHNGKKVTISGQNVLFHLMKSGPKWTIQRKEKGSYWIECGDKKWTLHNDRPSMMMSIHFSSQCTLAYIVGFAI